MPRGGSGSKLKGNIGERELCKKLGEAFGGSFTRVPNSGAITGGTNAFRRQSLSEGQIRAFKGDIIPPDELKHLVIESKFYKEFSYHRLVMGEDVNELETWLSELDNDCEDGDIGILCIKINRIGWMIVLEPFEGINVKEYSTYKGKWVTALDYFLDNNKDTFIELVS